VDKESPSLGGETDPTHFQITKNLGITAEAFQQRKPFTPRVEVQVHQESINMATKSKVIPDLVKTDVSDQDDENEFTYRDKVQLDTILERSFGAFAQPRIDVHTKALLRKPISVIRWSRKWCLYVHHGMIAR
jgi:hypothetical protein